MYPTRISEVQWHRSARNARNRQSRMSATLIDQMFCRLTDINSAEYSGIVRSAISDHFPYFLVLDNMKNKDHKPKFVEIRNNDATSFALFLSEVASAMESQILENDLLGDPNDNYTIFEEITFKAKAIHLQPKQYGLNDTNKNSRLRWQKPFWFQSRWEINYSVNLSQRQKHLPITPIYNIICLNIRSC